MRCALRIDDLDPLLINLPCFRLTDILLWTQSLLGKPLVLAVDKIGFPCSNATEEIAHAKVAVHDSYVRCCHCGQDFSQQRALLCMPILTRKYIDSHLVID